MIWRTYPLNVAPLHLLPFLALLLTEFSGVRATSQLHCCAIFPMLHQSLWYVQWQVNFYVSGVPLCQCTVYRESPV